MRTWARVLVVAAVGFGASLAARADSFSSGLSGSVDGFGGSGTLYAVDNNLTDGSYTIEQVTGPGVTGLTSFNGNDNLFFPNMPNLLDGSGFSFTDSYDGVDYKVRLFGNGDGTYSADVTGTDLTNLQDAAADFGTIPAGSVGGGIMHNVMLRANSSLLPGEEAFSFRFAAATPSAVAPTPEPGSFALMGTGLLGAAALVKRRARH